MQSFTSHSMLDDDMQIQIRLQSTGVSFSIGKILHPIPQMESFICKYDEAEELLEAALSVIKLRRSKLTKNG